MTPLVSVVVAHHLPENQPYLDLCLSSLAANQDVATEIHLVSDALRCPAIPEGAAVTLHHRPELDNATKKVHWVMDKLHPESKYLLLVGDDVMLSRGTIKGLVEGAEAFKAATGRDAPICNPLSNNELGGRFVTEMRLKNHSGQELLLKNNMSRQELYGFEEAVLEHEARPPFLIPVDWVSFFCTLIARDLWTALGGLDPALEVSHNDVDFCRRAQGAGAAIILNLGVFALHFGGKTLPKVTAPSDYRASEEHFIQKWGDGQGL